MSVWGDVWGVSENVVCDLCVPVKCVESMKTPTPTHLIPHVRWIHKVFEIRECMWIHEILYGYDMHASVNIFADPRISFSRSI